jgi:hypothetical protein
MLLDQEQQEPQLVQEQELLEPVLEALEQQLRRQEPQLEQELEQVLVVEELH